MKRNLTDVNQQVETALNSINNVQRASPKPYLLTRINSRINNPAKSAWENIALFISRPTVMALGLCIIIVINLSVIYLHIATKNSTPAEYAASTEEDEYATPFVFIDNSENP